MNSLTGGITPLLNEKGEPFIEVIDYDGYLFPNLLAGHRKVGVAKHFAECDQLGFEGDEICIASYPKTGTHWVYEVCNMLKAGNTDFLNGLIPNFDYGSMKMLKVVQATNRIHSSHMYPRHIPKQLLKKRCKLILVYRNPKDAAVSYFDFSKKVKAFSTGDMCLSEFLRHYMSGNVVCGSWVQWIEEWKSFKIESPDYPLLEISFEDMKMAHGGCDRSAEDAYSSMAPDPAFAFVEGPCCPTLDINLKECVQKISDFLDLHSTPELIMGIARKCEFEVMGNYKKNNVPKNMRLVTDFNDTHIFYRKGEVGNWKNRFTVADSEAFDKAMEAIIPRLGFNFTYELSLAKIYNHKL